MWANGVHGPKGSSWHPTEDRHAAVTRTYPGRQRHRRSSDYAQFGTIMCTNSVTSNSRRTTDTPTMIDEQIIKTAAEIIEYLNDPHNAFGIWIAATGVLAGAYFLTPFLPEVAV